MKRPLVLIILSFILGIIFMNIKRTIFYMVLFFFVLFLLFNKEYLTSYDRKYLISSKRIKKEKMIKLFLIMLLAFVFGNVYANIDYLIKTEYISQISNKEVKINGIIVDKEENEYLLKNVRIENKKIRGKVKIISDENYEILEELAACVVLELPNQSMNIGGFDYRQYLYSKNIVAVGKEVCKETKFGIKLNFLESGSIKIREYISKEIDSSYPDKEAQILKAILIGKSSSLEDEVKEFYQDAGIIHILVVSGAHIVLIIEVLKVLLSRLKISKQYYNFLLIFLIVFYIYITGSGESILRAGVVSIIALIASILGRQNDNITTIFLSAFILALINPMIIYSVGFQLSFAGALGIIILSPKIKNILNVLPKWIGEALSVTLAAQLFVLPITAYHFNSINLTGVISSLVVMPLINLIMPLGFIGIIPVVKSIAINANYFLISLMTNNAKLLSYLDIFNITVATPNLYLIIVYYMGIITWVMWTKGKTKIIKTLIVVSALIFVVINIKAQDLEVNFLYVGHGDSIFIVTPRKKTILIDTGDKYSYKDTVYNMAEKTVIPFVLNKGYKNIDLMILSHLDSDHAGGTETILQKLNVKQLIVGKNSTKSKRFDEIKEICNNEGVKLSIVSAGSRFNIDDIKFEVLSPFSELNETENNNSVVMMMTYKEKKILFMGDMELEGEEILVKKYNMDADVLKVGHHGSITSSTEELIKEVSPDIAIISVGDRFDSLPSKEVLNRLNESTVYITKKDGGIRLSIDKSGNIKVKTAISRN